MSLFVYEMPREAFSERQLTISPSGLFVTFRISSVNDRDLHPANIMAVCWLEWARISRVVMWEQIRILRDGCPWPHVDLGKRFSVGNQQEGSDLTRIRQTFVHTTHSCFFLCCLVGFRIAFLRWSGMRWFASCLPKAQWAAGSRFTERHMVPPRGTCLTPKSIPERHVPSNQLIWNLTFGGSWFGPFFWSTRPRVHWWEGTSLFFRRSRISAKTLFSSRAWPLKLRTLWGCFATAAQVDHGLAPWQCEAGHIVHGSSSHVCPSSFTRGARRRPPASDSTSTGLRTSLGVAWCFSARPAIHGAEFSSRQNWYIETSILSEDAWSTPSQLGLRKSFDFWNGQLIPWITLLAIGTYIGSRGGVGPRSIRFVEMILWMILWIAWMMLHVSPWEAPRLDLKPQSIWAKFCLCERCRSFLHAKWCQRVLGGAIDTLLRDLNSIVPWHQTCPPVPTLNTVAVPCRFLEEPRRFHLL